MFHTAIGSVYIMLFCKVTGHSGVYRRFDVRHSAQGLRKCLNKSKHNCGRVFVEVGDQTLPIAEVDSLLKLTNN